MVTLQDIADKVGVSKGTVSKALNGAPDVSEAMQKSVLETAIAMGYTKVRRMKTPTKKLCMLIENMEYEKIHHFGYDFIVGFKQLAEPAGFLVDVLPIDDKLQKSIPYDVFMLQNNYAGAFILGLTLNDPWMKDFKTCKTPTVLYDNYVKANPYVSSIGIDNTEGMELAVSHLKSLGHKNIGYLSSALGSYIMQVRFQAFLSAMRSNGLKVGNAHTGVSYYISECLQKHLPRFLNSGITAVICSHDQIAIAAMMECRQLGYSIPDDISFIGFDDLPVSAYAQPPLTSVRQDCIELDKCGFSALSSIFDQVAIGTILLHARLIIRESTGLNTKGL